MTTTLRQWITRKKKKRHSFTTVVMIFVIVVIAFVLTHEERKSLSKFKSIRKKKKKKKKQKQKHFRSEKIKFQNINLLAASPREKKKEKVRHKIKETNKQNKNNFFFFFFFFFYKIFPIKSNLLKFETASSLFLSVGTVRPERSTKQPEKEGKRNGGEICLVSFVSRHATIAKNMKKIIINKNKQRVTECVLFPFTSSPICPFFFPMWWTSFLTRWLHTLPIPLLEE